MTQKEQNAGEELHIILEKLDGGKPLKEQDWEALISHTTKLAKANAVNMVDFSNAATKKPMKDSKDLDLLSKINAKLAENLKDKEFTQKHLLATGIHKKLNKFFLNIEKSKSWGDKEKDRPSIQGKGRSAL